MDKSDVGNGYFPIVSDADIKKKILIYEDSVFAKYALENTLTNEM